MPEGMIENDQFNYPIITPTTKAENGLMMKIYLEKKYY